SPSPPPLPLLSHHQQNPAAYQKPPESCAETPALHSPHASQSSRSAHSSGPHSAALPPAKTQSSSYHSFPLGHSELACAPDAPSFPQQSPTEPFDPAPPAPRQPQHAPAATSQTPGANPSPPSQPPDRPPPPYN